MSGELRARHMEGERWKMEARLADPPSTLEGECWIRPDLAPEPDQLGTLRVDVGNSTLDVPIFAGGTSSADIEESLRIQLNNDVGYVPLAPLQDATYPELRVQQSSGTYGMHDAVEVSAIPDGVPDGVVSRPEDDTTASVSTSFGLFINSGSDYGEIAARISSNTSGHSRARLYDYSTGTYELSKDISALSAGDTFSFSYGFASGVDYAIELDNNGSSWTVGFAANATNYPYSDSSIDIDIVARSEDGTQVTNDNALAINDIGDPDSVLG